MKPIDVPTRETTEFLSSHLPSGARVLEVGCGDGDVALALERLGHRVTAIDANDETVARARARGVTARCASWPDLETEHVDAIAFTRSLHHIGPLAPAIEKARAVAGDDGVLLVEDFAFERAAPGVLTEFAGKLRTHEVRGLIEPVEGELITDLLAGHNPERVWQERHERFDLHPFGAMLEAVRGRFASVGTSSVPYLYRYLVRVLPESAAAAALVEELLAWEQAQGEEKWIGRRIVARADAISRPAPRA